MADKLCAIWGKPEVEQFKPFCSRRCADVDLNRWLSGVYAVPTNEAEDEDGVERDVTPYGGQKARHGPLPTSREPRERRCRNKDGGQRCAFARPTGHQALQD